MMRLDVSGSLVNFERQNGYICSIKGKGFHWIVHIARGNLNTGQEFNFLVIYEPILPNRVRIE